MLKLFLATHTLAMINYWISSFEKTAAAAADKSLQSCPTLCDPIDSSPPGSRIPGILQARTLEWGAISFSNAWKWKVKVKSLSHVRLLATPWTTAYQAPPSMGFSRQEYWSRIYIYTYICIYIHTHTFWRSDIQMGCIWLKPKCQQGCIPSDGSRVGRGIHFLTFSSF